jgi:phosphate-selective porin OprO/OprP
MKIKLLVIIGFSLLFINSICSQAPVSIVTKREKGIEIIQKDSLFSMQFQFRMQNRAAYMSESEKDLTPKDFEFRVRRLRMRLKGFVVNPKFGYHVQLSFSRADMDWESTNESSINTSPNIVRDAVLFYEPSKTLKFAFGQTKLPGNRQRVVSSGNLQFADRSIVNSTFTLDRDFGFFATFDKNYYTLKAALTSGEGRNSNKSTKGLNYTGRVELFPLGKFTSGNDECEGDLTREQKPKLAICVTYNFNDEALRQGGTIGGDLFTPTDMKNLHLDLLFKYKGFAFYQEYLNRYVNNPVVKNTDDGSLSTIYTGYGILSQVSYLFKNNYEIAARYAMIKPRSDLYNNSVYYSLNLKQQQHIQMGVTKYIYGHRLKVQGNLLYHIESDLKNQTVKKQLGAIFQVELGI